ncbi:hypothetical protein [Rhizorhapis sp.]|uniref:hypothetical protein n=1 Tax=Rhizorhapis sp. TaxID=1968842 RepID=UPI002B46F937|nr:hypothetical protein [Rhizorhapis sp.]HKR17673.1 hypothetical protein [Rhizorhapis sp.]
MADPISQAARDFAAEYLPTADEDCGECERGLMCDGGMDHHWLVQAIGRAMADQRERDAEIAYRVCAETRHVTLGDKAATAIRAQKGDQ